MSFNPSDKNWISMSSKFEGMCEICDDAFQTSSPIYWNLTTKKVRHESCHMIARENAPNGKFDWKEHLPENGKIFRHGDLLIREVTEFPKNLRKTDSNVIAEGEVTGHLHKLDGDHKIYDGIVDKFFEAFEEVNLTHDEHKMLKIPKGKYIVLNEREYNPWDEDIQEVYD